MRTSKEELAGFLRDCGVQPEALSQILACEGCKSRLLCLLSKERSSLLDDLHQAQRRLDLMDLLMDLLQKEDRDEER